MCSVNIIWKEKLNRLGKMLSAMPIDANDEYWEFFLGQVKIYMSDLEEITLSDTAENALQAGFYRYRALANYMANRYPQAKVDCEQSIASYSEAIKNMPPELSECCIVGAYASHILLGLICYKNGDCSGALSNYDNAIKIDGEKAEAYVRKGYAYHKKGQVEESVASFKKAIELELACREAYFGLAYVYCKAKRPDLAMEFCERLSSF